MTEQIKSRPVKLKISSEDVRGDQIKYMKINYHRKGQDNEHFYLDASLREFEMLKKKITDYLLNRKLELSEVRIYWIDKDGDKIVLTTQHDYAAFRNLCKSDLILHVTPCLTTEDAYTTNMLPRYNCSYINSNRGGFYP